MTTRARRAARGRITVRRARVEDLPAVWDVLYEQEYGERSSGSGSSSADMPPVLAHEQRTGEMWVAEDRSGLLGYAATVPRDGITFVAELFVRRRAQSHGLGGRLLAALLGRTPSRACTMSSGDAKALGLYVRAGMRPAWPHVQLLLPAGGTGERGADAAVVEAHPDDRDLTAWDARIGGRRRRQDHRYWQAGLGAVPLWCRRRTRAIGYGYVWPDASGTPARRRETARTIVGPVGARTPADAEVCVAAVIAYARRFGLPMQLGVPGPHPSLGPLLRGGGRILYLETFCSRGAAFFDPRCYLPSTTAEGTALL